ncbi:MAG: insulinase family protein [Candidatus Eisenbacteria bacterium]
MIVALAVATSGAFAADPVRWGYLSNGLEYLVIANHAAPLVGSTAIVHAGSAAEDAKTQGASHFLEHLLFNGTETMSQEELYAAFDRMGVYHNATTRPTHMAHFILSPSESFPRALRLQQSMVFHSVLSAEKVEKERGIIIEELAKDRDNGDYDQEQILLADAFGSGGYGLPTLGTPESIRNLSREELQGFYQRFYAAGNVTWILIGDIDPDAAIDSLEATVGGEIPREVTPNAIPTLDLRAPRVRIHHLPVETPVVQLMWQGPAPSSLEYTAYRAKTEISMGGESSPFGSALARRLGARLGGYGFELAEYPGLSLTRVRLDLPEGADPESLVTVFEQVRAQVAGLPLDPAALAAWRTRQEADEEFLREKPHYYGILRGEALAARGLPAMAMTLRSIRDVTVAQVEQAANPLARPADRVTILMPDTPTSAPDSASAGPTTMERFSLANGAEVVLLSSPESGVLAIHGFIRDRSAREPAGGAGAAELLHLALAEGPVTLTPEQFGRRLDELGVEWKTADDPRIPYDDFYSVPEWSYLRVQGLDRNAAATLDLVAQTLRSPRLSQETFDRARQVLIERAEKGRKSGREAVRRLVDRTLWQRSGVYGDAASLQSLDLTAIRRWAPTYLDPSGMLFVVATSLPVQEARSVLERSLGTLAAGVPPYSPAQEESAAQSIRLASAFAPGATADGSALARDLAGPDRDTPPPAVLVDSVGAAQANLQLFRLIGQVSEADRAALTVANAILSDRFAFQLREREGLAYSIGSNLVRTPQGSYLWQAGAGAQVSALPRIVEGVRAAVDSLAASVPSVDETAQTIGKLRGAGLMRRATRINLAYATGVAILRGVGGQR